VARHALGPRAPAAPATVAARGISKRFGGVRALDRASIGIERGEVHGLLGENGSGKSTLVNILAGWHEPQPGGELEIDGRAVELPLRPDRARALGVAFVPQDLGLVPSLSVTENVRMAELAAASRPFISWRRERIQAAAALARIGVEIDPAATVASLGPAQRTQLAIGRAVQQLPGRGAEAGGLLVLDESTAYLPHDQRPRLYELIREVAAAGNGVLFVSHDLAETLAITDRITVLRDGRNAGTLETAACDSGRLIELILGVAPVSQPTTTGSPSTDRRVAASVTGLSGNVVRDLSFSVGGGEVVGITGLAGSGFEEVPYLLFGALRPRAGQLQLDARHELTAMTPSRAVAAGIALVPGDRARDAGVASLSVCANVTLPVLDRYTGRRGLDRRRMDRDVAVALARHDVRPPTPAARLGSLSGGNQQKALLAKWIETRPRLLLLDEPMSGVDVGAREPIADSIAALTREGAAVLCASSDHEELARLCHRVLVFGVGELVSELAGAQLTTARISEHCQAAAAPGPSR
jgi:ribose transport system ATP-binding protein